LLLNGAMMHLELVNVTLTDILNAGLAIEATKNAAAATQTEQLSINGYTVDTIQSLLYTIMELDLNARKSQPRFRQLLRYFTRDAELCSRRWNSTRWGSSIWQLKEKVEERLIKWHKPTKRNGREEEDPRTGRLREWRRPPSTEPDVTTAGTPSDTSGSCESVHSNKLTKEGFTEERSIIIP
jgi:hypothetical protein